MYMALIVFQAESQTAKVPIDDLKGFYSLFCCSYIDHSNQDGHHSFNNTFLWLIVPQILNGIGQLLVHMTNLEFICAQAPITM